MKTVDVIGLIKDVGIASEIQLKNGSMRQKRVVSIFDDSQQDGIGINLCFWGNSTKLDDAQSGQVLSVKGARVSEYNQAKSLNVGEDNVYEINPSDQRSTKLQLYYQRNGGDFPNLKSLSESQRQDQGAGGRSD